MKQNEKELGKLNLFTKILSYFSSSNKTKIFVFNTCYRLSLRIMNMIRDLGGIFWVYINTKWHHPSLYCSFQNKMRFCLTMIFILSFSSSSLFMRSYFNSFTMFVVWNLLVMTLFSSDFFSVFCVLMINYAHL